jgi:hypothetical protein
MPYKLSAELLRTCAVFVKNVTWLHTLIRLLARVLKEGVQFWYNYTSTVHGRGFEKTFLGKPLKFTLLHACQYLFQARSKFFKHTWLYEFLPLCFFTYLNYDIFIQTGTPSNWSKCQMYSNNENWSYFVSDILIYLGKSLKIISLFRVWNLIFFKYPNGYQGFKIWYPSR